MKPAAKFRMYRGFQIRLSQDGDFSIDSVSGEWETLAEAKKAIDTAVDKEVRINALRSRGGISDGKVDNLQPVVFLGMDNGSETRARIESRSGKENYKTACYLTELHPDTPEVKAAWARYQAAKLDAYKKEREADRLGEAIAKFKP